jgi:hypothetical protein
MGCSLEQQVFCIQGKTPFRDFQISPLRSVGTIHGLLFRAAGFSHQGRTSFRDFKFHLSVSEERSMVCSKSDIILHRSSEVSTFYLGKKTSSSRLLPMELARASGSLQLLSQTII